MSRQQERKLVALPVVSPTPASRMGRRRAVSLILVHVLILIHIGHWLGSGSTLSPLEPSEASFTLLNGAINAGAVFLVVLILSTLIFGRFFCGWACHVVAYQDLARWILIKLRIRPRPVRSRLLFLVPLFAAFWLYALPSILRWADSRKGKRDFELSWHLTESDFWATFPGPTISILTFLICGFIIIYFLGSKGFCFYGCPYGGLFGVADKFAKGRIRVTDACDGSSLCTANCSSNVDVATEVRLYGKVVDTGCLKCMDCISGCPNDALYFGFSPRGVRKQEPSHKQERKVRGFDFSWPEEIMLATAFAVCFAVYNDLYRTIPLLMAIGLSSITAYLVVVLYRLARTRTVRLQNLSLKLDGKVTPIGRAYSAVLVGVLALVFHSAAMQWHARQGVSQFEIAHRARQEGDSTTANAAISQSARHLEFCDRWGLFHTRGLGRMMGQISLWTGRTNDAVDYFTREFDAGTYDPSVPIMLGSLMSGQGRTEDAHRYFRAAVEGRKGTPERVLRLSKQCRAAGEASAAREVLRIGLERSPANGDLALALCKLLAGGPNRSLKGALRIAESTCRSNNRQHADLLAMLAWLYAKSGRPHDALIAAEQSLARANEQGLSEIARAMEEMVLEYRQSATRAP